MQIENESEFMLLYSETNLSERPFDAVSGDDGSVSLVGAPVLKELA